MRKVRDVRFDTLKGFLILSVVFGHFFTHEATHGVVSQALANFIYSYHMPLFVFVSGYFADNQRFVKGGVKILETYVVFQLIKGLWYHYSVLWLFIMPGPMLWYLFALFFWKLLNVGLNKVGIKVTPYWIIFCVVLSLAVGFVPWIGREFALSRFVFFAPYFFLGVYAQKIHILDLICSKVNLKICCAVLMATLLFGTLCAAYSVKIRGIFAGTHPYRSDWQLAYLAARLVSYLTSTIVSVSFIRAFSFENKLIAIIGRDSLKYYMFHGVCLMAIEALGMPWSTPLAIAYAIIVSASIFFFNKTAFSDILISPIGFVITKIKYKNNYNNDKSN